VRARICRAGNPGKCAEVRGVPNGDNLAGDFNMSHWKSALISAAVAAATIALVFRVSAIKKIVVGA
jgi:hypothetical protein